MTNRAGRNKQNIVCPPNVTGLEGGLPGRRHSRVVAEQDADLDNNALPTSESHGASDAQRATKSKKGRYRAKTHRLIKGAEVRKIRTGRRNHFVGDVPMTRLNGKLVSGESLLEIDALTVLDFDGGVSSPGGLVMRATSWRSCSWLCTQITLVHCICAPELAVCAVSDGRA